MIVCPQTHLELIWRLKLSLKGTMSIVINKELLFTKTFSPLKPEHKPWVNPRNEHPFVVYFFNYFHFLCLFPFRIQWDPYRAQYIPITGRIRRVLCGLVLIAEVIREIWDFYWKSPLKKLDDSIVYIFEMVSYIFTVPILWSIMLNFCFRADTVLKWIGVMRDEGRLWTPMKVHHQSHIRTSHVLLNLVNFCILYEFLF